MEQRNIYMKIEVSSGVEKKQLEKVRKQASMIEGESETHVATKAEPIYSHMKVVWQQQLQ